MISERLQLGINVGNRLSQLWLHFELTLYFYCKLYHKYLESSLFQSIPIEKLNLQFLRLFKRFEKAPITNWSVLIKLCDVQSSTV